MKREPKINIKETVYNASQLAAAAEDAGKALEEVQSWLSAYARIYRKTQDGRKTEEVKHTNGSVITADNIKEWLQQEGVTKVTVKVRDGKFRHSVKIVKGTLKSASKKKAKKE